MPQRNQEGASAAQADADDIREGICTSPLLAEVSTIREGICTSPLLAVAGTIRANERYGYNSRGNQSTIFGK